MPDVPIFPIQVARDHAQSLQTVAETARMEGREPAKAAELVIDVPAGSTVTAVVSGGDDAEATLDIDGIRTPFERLDNVNRHLQQPLEKSGRMSIAHDGRTLGSGIFAFVPMPRPSSHSMVRRAKPARYPPPRLQRGRRLRDHQASR